MTRLRRLLRRPSADLHLLVQSVLWVAAIRLGLWLLPFRALRGLLVGASGTTEGVLKTYAPDVRRVTWAVDKASRCVPAATCLTQALAAVVLLGRLRQPASLKIGVARSTDGRLEAHAWVESGGEVVIGRLEDMSRYSVLSPSTKDRL